jgi:hypothetical protein
MFSSSANTRAAGRVGWSGRAIAPMLDAVFDVVGKVAVERPLDFVAAKQPAHERANAVEDRHASSGYSYRSTLIGSTRDARRAGM